MDGFLQSDRAHREMMVAACGDSPTCMELPHFFRAIKQVDPEAYDAFVAKARTAFNTPGQAAQAGFAFALEAMNTATRYLDDDAIQVVLADTALSIREMKATYPQLCVALLSGQVATPPPQVARQMFKPERYKLNVSMLQTAASNRARVDKGELTLPTATSEEVVSFSENYFLSLPEATLIKVDAMISGPTSEADSQMACDVMTGLLNAIAAKPKAEAGAMMRGLTAVPM